MYGGRIVEKAPAKEIFTRPHHPYTQGLLASIPRLDGDPEQPLPAIEGMPPDLLALPAGCAFAPRCPRASSECAASKPALIEISAGHLKACFNT
jgi:oligopeptide transport system ATP-binding protein